MTFEEHSELVQPGVGDDVDDPAAASEMNDDRQPVWEVPHGARVTVAEGDVGQVGWLDPDQGCQVRGLLSGRAARNRK